MDSHLVVDRLGTPFLFRRRIELLESIGQTGSISKAAKAIGISYKAAWDTVEAINNLSESPLVVRSIGGKSGGGTVLTDYAMRLLKAIQDVEMRTRRDLEEAIAAIANKGLARTVQCLASVNEVKNMFAGTVTTIERGAVNSELVIGVAGENDIVAIVPRAEVDDLALEVGSPVFAFFKSSSVLVSSEVGLKISARNRLSGRMSRLEKGRVASTIAIALAGGKTVHAMVDNASLEDMSFAEDQPIAAFVKASSVFVATRH